MNSWIVSVCSAVFVFIVAILSWKHGYYHGYDDGENDEQIRRAADDEAHADRARGES